VARAQYRFSDFGYPANGSTASFTDTRICTGCASAMSSPLTIAYQLPLMQHVYEFGVAYKFGPGGPPGVLPAANAPPAAVFSWTGFYIGANAGYGWAPSSATTTFTGNPFFSNIASTGSDDLKGAIVGGQIGFNYQIGAAVLGIEADVDWSGQKKAKTTSCGPSCTFDESLEANALSTVRARAGWLIDRFLVYATAGVASVHAKDIVNVTVGGLTRNLVAFQPNRAGWIVGAGVELPLGAGFSGKLEYLYIAAEEFSQTASFPAVSGGGTVTETVSIRDNLLRAGINYHF
jgi:outer membrane immunogenic protein